MRSPCYKCPDREIGCHGRCEKYIAFADWSESQRKERKTALDATAFQVDAVERKKLLWSKKTGKSARGRRVQ